MNSQEARDKQTVWSYRFSLAMYTIIMALTLAGEIANPKLEGGFPYAKLFGLAPLTLLLMMTAACAFFELRRPKPLAYWLTFLVFSGMAFFVAAAAIMASGYIFLLGLVFVGASVRELRKREVRDALSGRKPRRGLRLRKKIQNLLASLRPLPPLVPIPIEENGDSQLKG